MPKFDPLQRFCLPKSSGRLQTVFKNLWRLVAVRNGSPEASKLMAAIMLGDQHVGSFSRKFPDRWLALLSRNARSDLLRVWRLVKVQTHCRDLHLLPPARL